MGKQFNFNFVNLKHPVCPLASVYRKTCKSGGVYPIIWHGGEKTADDDGSISIDWNSQNTIMVSFKVITINSAWSEAIICNLNQFMINILCYMILI